MERKLAAILAADIAGFSRLVGTNEEATLAAQRAQRLELIDPLVETHRGRIANTAGDSLLIEFASAVEAVCCAIAIQQGLAERNADVPADRRIEYRIGINVGDVIVQGDDLLGDGVNIAARLETLAPPGGILVSSNVSEQIRDRLELAVADLGEVEVKNITRPVHAFQVLRESEVPIKIASPRRSLGRGGLAALAGIVVAFAIVASVAVRFWPATGDELPPLPSGPKIAIIPFAELGSDDKTAQLAVGLTEDVAAALSRFSDLFVYSLNATAPYKGQSVDPRRIKEELGTQYVLEGSVRRSETGIRVVAKLVDAGDAKRLWSETYDRALTASDFFEVMDEITAGVVATIGSPDGVIALREAQVVRARRTDSLQAFECTAQMAWFGRSLSGEARAEMRACLEEAVRRSPDYARAWSDLANVLIETYKNQAFSEAEARDMLERADDAAKRAIELDAGNETAYYRRAIISQLRGEGYAAFKALADKALAINPNNSLVVGDIGNFSYYSGDFDRGKALVARMMKIDPRYPSWAHFVFFLDHYRNGEYPEALQEG